ncbi:MAG: metalloprotease [Acidimicrobiia bacterium]
MFRLFGFDVHVRAGFVIFLVLIAMINPSTFGLWVAVGIAGFTLLHELGHAVAARRAGADAEISLDFLAGYTSFRSRRPLTRPQQAGITAAGPFTQISISVVVLLALGANPLSLDSVRESDLTYAIWWAGPVIGVLNLIPVLPLDGGHLVHTALEPILGRDSMRTMAIVSMVVTVGGAVVFYAIGYRGFTIFIAFLLLTQYQLLQSTSQRSTRGMARRSHDAESLAWQTGRPGVLEPGQRLSPWYEAHRALAQGDEGGAIGVMLADLRSSQPRNWLPPAAAAPGQLRAIVDVLPTDLPHGNVHSSRVLAEILLALGDVQRAGAYAAQAFTEHRSTMLAAVVARAAAATGDPENALRWLGAAVDAASNERPGTDRVLAQIFDRAPELGPLRSDPAFGALRARLD